MTDEHIKKIAEIISEDPDIFDDDIIHDQAIEALRGGLQDEGWFDDEDRAQIPFEREKRERRDARAFQRSMEADEPWEDYPEMDEDEEMEHLEHCPECRARSENEDEVYHHYADQIEHDQEELDDELNRPDDPFDDNWGHHGQRGFDLDWER